MTKITSLLLAALAIVLLTGSSEAQSRFDCKVDLVVGYKFDENQRIWVASQFRAGQQYVVRRLTEEERQQQSEYKLFGPKEADWGVFVPDDRKFWSYACVSNSGYHIDSLMCGFPWQTQFVFNATVLRFQTYYKGHYVLGRDNTNEDTPSIEIGRCKVIEW